MSGEFFSLVFEALVDGAIDSKLARLRDIKASFHLLDFSHDSPVMALDAPSYASFCAIVHPTRIKRPKHCDSIKSLAKILHSVAHIEYSAIDLGLDAAYRFRGMPIEYYAAFLDLAYQEVEHFLMVDSILRELGYAYGDFCVHEGLFTALQRSPKLIERMALVHKGLEALGLDANPFVAKKIEASKSLPPALKSRILEALAVILRDEIGHVKTGAKWLDYAQKQALDSRSFVEILAPFRDLSLVGRVPNIGARLQAGYTEAEIDALRALN